VNKLQKFFLTCSGADLTILSSPECRIDRDKYTGIGFTVLITGLLASLSGGYALFTVFRSIASATLFGLIWGSMIFNLDRSIVQSIRKTNSGNDLAQIFIVLPRLVLALIIALTVSKPLELKLFEREIAAEMEKQNLEARTQAQKEAKNAFPDITKLEAENEQLKRDIREGDDRQQQLHDAVIGEAEGTTGTKKEGLGPIYEKKKAELDSFEKHFYRKRDKTEKQIEALKG
jgi:Domain of unknown function (DUF4407)